MSIFRVALVLAASLLGSLAIAVELNYEKYWVATGHQVRVIVYGSVLNPTTMEYETETLADGLVDEYGIVIIDAGNGYSWSFDYAIMAYRTAPGLVEWHNSSNPLDHTIDGFWLSGQQESLFSPEDLTPDFFLDPRYQVGGQTHALFGVNANGNLVRLGYNNFFDVESAALNDGVTCLYPIAINPETEIDALLSEGTANGYLAISSPTWDGISENFQVIPVSETIDWGGVLAPNGRFPLEVHPFRSLPGSSRDLFYFGIDAGQPIITEGIKDQYSGGNPLHGLPFQIFRDGNLSVQATQLSGVLDSGQSVQFGVSFARKFRWDDQWFPVEVPIHVEVVAGPNRGLTGTALLQISSVLTYESDPDYPSLDLRYADVIYSGTLQITPRSGVEPGTDIVRVSGSFDDSEAFTVVWTVTGDAVANLPDKPGPEECPYQDGLIIQGLSRVRTSTMAYVHDAVDYRPGSSDQGCGSCGGGVASTGPWPQVALNRIHRYRDADWIGSFGPGVFSQWDHRVRAHPSAGVIEWFDPTRSEPVVLTTAGDGTWTDEDLRSIASGTLLAAAGGPSPATLDDAAGLDLIAHDGTTYHFAWSTAVTGGERWARLTTITNAAGVIISTLTYVNPATSTPDGTWYEMASITDAYGISLTVTSITDLGSRVISVATPPTGQSIAYGYGDSALVGVGRVAYLTGEVSTFTTEYVQGRQRQDITFVDAGAEGMHKRKTVSFTVNVTTSLTGVDMPTPPNRVRQVVLPDGTLSFLSWLEPHAADPALFDLYIFDGGGTDGTGSMRRVTSDNGIITKSERATTWSFDVDQAQWQWEEVGSYTTTSGQRLGATTDSLDRKTELTRDPVSGAILGRTRHHPDGSIYAASTTSYNTFKQPLVQVDELGRRTVSTYDAQGNLLTQTVAQGTADEATTSWTYRADGQPLTMTDALGRVTEYAYTAQGFLASRTDPPDISGGPRPVWQWIHDAAGRLERTLDPEGRTAVYTYDSRNRIAAIAYQNGTSETFTYGTGLENANELIAMTDRNGHRSEYQYDLAGRRTVSISGADDPAVAITETCTYLPGTDLLASCSGGGKQTSYVYDTRKRRVQTIQHVNATQTLTETTVYDAHDRVDRTTDAYGRSTYFVYDIEDRVIRQVRELVPGGVSDPAQRATLARIATGNPPYVIEDSEFDVAGQLTARIDGRGLRTTFQYDAQGRQTQVTEAAGTAEAATSITVYDLVGNVIQTTSPGNRIVASTYTGRNQVATRTQGFGTAEAATEAYTYTLTGKMQTVTDARGFATTNVYGTCCDWLEKVIDPLGFETLSAYDGKGQLISMTDANGNVTTTAYDALDRRLAMTNGAGESTTLAYDTSLGDGLGLDALLPPALSGVLVGLGTAQATTDPTGAVRVTFADGLGRPVAAIDPHGVVSSMQYDVVVDGLVAVATTDGVGNVTTLRTDGAGRARQSVDALGVVSTGSFDANGNALAVLDGNGLGRVCAYDARNRPITCSDPSSASWSRTYDLDGNVLTQTDALNKTTIFTYDALSRKTSVVDRINAGTFFVYDLASHLIRQVDAEGGTTDYTFDQRGLLSSETFPQGQQGRTQKTYAYDAGRRLIGRQVTTVPTATVTETTVFAYDAANRLISRQYQDGAIDTLAYDLASRLTSADSSRYRVNVGRTYDIAGRLTGEDLIFLDGGVAGTTVSAWTYHTGYAHDDANRTTTVTYPDGRVVTRTFTQRHELDTVVLDGSLVVDRGYDDGGRLGIQTFGNGLVESRGYKTGTNLVEAIVVPGVTSFTYGYDDNKRKTAETDALQASRSQTFGYDDQDRMTAWSRPAGADAQSWLLSPVGDWQSMTRNGVTETRTHNGVHEVTTVGTAALAYDGKGNLTRDADGRTFHWDDENRMTRAEVPSGASPTGFGIVASYQYDALGRRVAKTVNGTTTRFLHDGQQVIVEVDLPVTPPQAEVDGADSDGTAAKAALPPATGGILQPATGTVTRINMQPAVTAIPAGYYADKGKLLGVRTNGLTYGWSSDATSRTVERHGPVPLKELDTFVRLQPTAGDAAVAWSIALPNGTYPVVVVSGDPLSTEHTNHLVIGGTAVTDPDPAGAAGYTQGDFDGYVVQVTVTNGFLDIAGDSGSLDPTVCLVEIGPEGSSIDAATTARLDALIDSATQRTWAPAPPLTATRACVWSGYVDELACLVSGGQRHYAHGNQQFSVSAMTAGSGQVEETFTYDSYGKRTVYTAGGLVAQQSEIDNATGYTGRFHDEEVQGQQYFRARYYSAGLGRFISRDRIGYRDGENLYFAHFVAYRTDPSGSLAVEITGNEKMSDWKLNDIGGDAADGGTKSWISSTYDSKDADSLDMVCGCAGDKPLWLRDEKDRTSGQDPTATTNGTGIACWIIWKKGRFIPYWDTSSFINLSTNADLNELVFRHEKGHLLITKMIAELANKKMENFVGYGHSISSEKEARREARAMLMADTLELIRMTNRTERLSQDGGNSKRPPMGSYDEYVGHDMIDVPRQREFDSGNWRPTPIEDFVRLDHRNVAAWPR